MTKAKGLRGEVVARLFNPASPLWQPGLRLFTIGGEQPEVTVETVNVQGKSAVLALAGVSTREQAEALVGVRLAVRRAALPPPAPDELYLSEVVGFAVRDAAGRELGVVTGIEEGGGRDFLVVEGGGRRELWPADPSAVSAIDAAARTLTLAFEGAE